MICVVIILVVLVLVLFIATRKERLNLEVLQDYPPVQSITDGAGRYATLKEKYEDDMNADHHMPIEGYVHIAKERDFDKQTDADKEYSLTHDVNFTPINTRLWPYDYYSFPYKDKSAGPWPPGMYTRLDKWYPGFETSGWSFYFRPGSGYKNWRRSTWVRHSPSKYFINNGHDRSHDYYGTD